MISANNEYFEFWNIIAKVFIVSLSYNRKIWLKYWCLNHCIFDLNSLKAVPIRFYLS
jgi:hypothetical protein